MKGLNEGMAETDKAWTPTAAMRRMFEVVANPATKARTIDQMCQEAGVARQTFYNWQNPYHESYSKDFTEAWQSAWMTPLKARLASINEKMAEEAEAGSVRHAELVARITKAIGDRQEISVKADVKFVTDDLDPHELTDLSGEEPV